jgi:hypothetical protein
VIRRKRTIPRPHFVLPYPLTDSLTQIRLSRRRFLGHFLFFRRGHLGIEIPAFVLCPFLLVLSHRLVRTSCRPRVERLSGIAVGFLSNKALDAAIGQRAIKEALAEILDRPVGLGLGERGDGWGKGRVTRVLRRWWEVVFGHTSLLEDIQRSVIETVRLGRVERKGV